MAEELEGGASPFPPDETPEEVQNRTTSPLKARQERVALALATGKTVEATCRELKVGHSTVWGWLRTKEFKERVEQLRQQLIDGAIGRLAELMGGKALDVLTKRLDRTDPETGEVAATLDDVKAAFDLFVGLKGNVELQAKLDKLLEMLGDGGKKR